MTDYYGNTIMCYVCKKKACGYKTHKPPFADAIDSVFIGYCEDQSHQEKAISEHQERENRKDQQFYRSIET